METNAKVSPKKLAFFADARKLRKFINDNPDLTMAELRTKIRLGSPVWMLLYWLTARNYVSKETVGVEDNEKNVYRVVKMETFAT